MDRTVNEVTRVVFECPVCKSVHKESGPAVNCADEHLQVIGVAVQYVGNFSKPDQLWLTFQDGSHMFLDWNEEGYVERQSVPCDNFIRLFGTDSPENAK